jgi:hypothetical protein
MWQLEQPEGKGDHKVVSIVLDWFRCRLMAGLFEIAWECEGPCLDSLGMCSIWSQVSTCEGNGKTNLSHFYIIRTDNQSCGICFCVSMPFWYILWRFVQPPHCLIFESVPNRNIVSCSPDDQRALHWFLALGIFFRPSLMLALPAFFKVGWTSPCSLWPVCPLYKDSGKASELSRGNKARWEKTCPYLRTSLAWFSLSADTLSGVTNFDSTTQYHTEFHIEFRLLVFLHLPNYNMWWPKCFVPPLRMFKELCLAEMTDNDSHSKVCQRKGSHCTARLSKYPRSFRSLFAGKLLHTYLFFSGAWLLEEKSKLTHKLSQIVTCHL